ncbi:hypothetical protein AB0878_36840 [Amycolatopsis sp. NPDC047767]|uniref:hypothetical protein n=1 Tax=Amycolatopsis sp. NPDC047767 TaxID=3156765 RepID=UPI003455173E
MTDAEARRPDPRAPWLTLDERDAGREPESEIYEGVPPHLVHDLEAWVSDTLAEDGVGDLPRLLLNSFRVSWDVPGRMTIRHHAVVRSIIRGETDWARSPRPLEPLSVLDALIALHPHWDNTRELLGYTTYRAAWGKRLGKLQELLRDTGSAWHVDFDLRGLYRRVDPTATQAWRHARAAAEDGGRSVAAKNLEEAWRLCYGQHPDPSASYSAAVKAVEAVAVPVIAPGTSKTVHAAARDLRGKLPGWEFVLVHDKSLPSGSGTADVVSAMLDRLLHGETNRHTSSDHNRPSTQAEAETAVHLAVTLVQWFLAGALTRKVAP